MDKLKQAKESLGRSVSRGSAGRESAEKSRELKSMLRKRSGVQGNVEVVPNAGLMMPARRSMVREGMMDMANKPDAAFGREMARERKKQQRENY